jgi:type IV pilus assembly protein PilB
VPVASMASALTLVICQRLVRRLSDYKEPYTMTKPELNTLRKHANLDKVLTHLKEEKIVSKIATWDTLVFYRPKKGSGVDQSHDGYIGIQEVIRISPAIQDVMLRGGTTEETKENITRQAQSEGVMTLVEDGIFKAVQGLISVEEVLQMTLAK